MKKLALTLLFLGATYSATRLVPGDYPSIQAAIDASVDYDTIQVDAGTYNENINFNGKNITVVGENQETTIIDGGANGSVVKFNSQEGEAAALTGFTITNGEAVEGGGIYISEESNPTLTSLTISGNTADYFGGGIYSDNFSNPTLTNLTISGNAANYAGGIFIWESSPILTNLTISGNDAGYYGGGVYIWESNPTLTNLTISGNTANYFGGGIYIRESSPILTNQTISGNAAEDGGGGVYTRDSNPTFISSIIWGNSADSDNSFYSYDEGSVPTVVFTNVQGDYWGAGNIDEDPLFVDPDNGDFSLSQGSPCIGAGLGGGDMGAHQSGFNNEDCSFEDSNEDGYDDTSYSAGKASVDSNNDGLVDEFPVISIVDGNAQVLIESSQGNYVDSGATCSDQEDGTLSHQVEVSGDVVNMNNPGTYTVSYNCSDSDGNAAQTKHRTVFVIGAPMADENEDGYDDDAFLAGAQSGDVNGDGSLNIADIIQYISVILNQ